MASSEMKTITAQCYCKSIHYTLTLPASSLPLPAHICHCSTCRYTHGTIHVTHAKIPKGVHPQFVAPSGLDGSLTRYVAFEGAKSERYFVSKFSGSLFFVSSPSCVSWGGPICPRAEVKGLPKGKPLVTLPSTPLSCLPKEVRY